MTVDYFDIKDICDWIRGKFNQTKMETAVIGISGGIDSAVVASLCVRALGGSRVFGLLLPCNSNQQSLDDGLLLVNHLGIKHQVRNLTYAYNAFCISDLADNPNNVALGNIKARLRMTALYDAAFKTKGLVVGTTNKTEASIGYACYDDQTRALTPNGLKYFSELSIGDKVFSMNLETQKLEELPIQDMFISNSYNGNLLEIKTKRINLLVTPDHKLVVAKNHGKGPVCLVEANKRIKNAGITCIPFPKGWDGKTDIENTIDTSIFLDDNKATYNSNKPIIFETNDFLYLMGLFIGDGCVCSSSIKTVTTGLTHKEFVSNREQSTGRFKNTNKSKNKEVIYTNYRINISSGKDKRSRQPLETLLQKYNIKYTATPTAILFSNSAISEAFKLCGHGAKNKEIPRWVLDLHHNRLCFLFKGLMDSDGNADGSGYNTSSEKLSIQFVELCLKLGLTANIANRKPKITECKGKTIRSGRAFYIGIASKRNNWTFREENTKLIPYTGTIWCPTVPPHGNLIIERNGKFVVCGNTKYGDHGVDIEPIQDFWKTEIFDMARVLKIPDQIINKKPTADLWNGQTDEEEIGLTYVEIDSILKHILEDGPYPGATIENYDKVLNMMCASEHKRKLPPFYKR